MNEVGAPGPSAPQAFGLGLLGVAERLSLLGGEVEAEQEGSTWLMRIEIPIK